MVVDTNIFIDHLRAKDKLKTALFNTYSNSELFISPVTIYELYMGVNSVEKKKYIELIVEPFQVYNFDKTISIEAANIFLQLKRKNQLIEFRDIFIAATCIINNQPLLTKNTKHIQRIKKLTLHNL